MGSPTYEALLKQLSWQKRYYDNHEPSADEVFDRVWFDKCMVLLDHITTAETQLEAITDGGCCGNLWKARAQKAEAQLKTRERTSQLHKDNHLAAERVIKRVRVLCDGWCGGVIFASGLRIERTVSLDQQRCANELDEILEKQDE